MGGGGNEGGDCTGLKQHSRRCPAVLLLTLLKAIESLDLARRLSTAMSAPGLGRVETPGRGVDGSRARREGDARSFFPDVAAIPTVSAADADSSPPGQFFNNNIRNVGGDYALIAAMSGWTPVMFMTRVRL